MDNKISTQAKAELVRVLGQRRTHKDAFEGVWYEVLDWLQQEPDVTAKSLLKRLQYKYLGCFADGQLRTLQRRVKEWRNIMARELVYACIE